MSKKIEVSTGTVNTGIPVNKAVQKKLNAWNEIEMLLDQDEELMAKKLPIQFPNEDYEAFKKRKEYFIRSFVNITQDLVTAPVNSVFRQEIREDFETDNSMLKTFSENVVLGNDDIPYARFLKDYVALGLRSYGNVFTVVDKPRILVNNKKVEREHGLPYLSNIRPQDVLNWEVGADGVWNWFAYRKVHVPVWGDPFNSDAPSPEDLEFLWTRTDLFVRNKDGKIVNDMSFKHGLGFVPVIAQASFLSKTTQIIGTATMEQSRNFIIMAGNLFNQGVHEIFKHGGALLLMHEDATGAHNFIEVDDGDTQLKRQDKNSMLSWGGENPPAYLVKELATSVIKEWGNDYLQRAIENERDLKSLVMKGNEGLNVENQSGVAKEIDREPLESNLVGLSEDLEIYTDKVYKMVSKILKVEDDHIFQIDKDFDIESLREKYSTIKEGQEARANEYSETLVKEMYKNLVGKVTRDIDTQKIIIDEIDNSNVDNIDESVGRLVDGAFSDKFKDEPNEGEDSEDEKKVK
jgi:hypothetical protein